jgi:hypothetical protein
VNNTAGTGRNNVQEQLHGELCLRQGHELQRGAKLSKSRISILQLNRHFSIILFEIRRFYLFVHTACEFNDEIMKIGHLNKTFHMKKLSMNLPVIKREKQIFKV